MGNTTSSLIAIAPAVVSAFPGEWTTHIDFGVIPVAGAVLPDTTNGKPQVLVWSSYSPYQFGGEKGYTATAIWNMNTGKVTPRKVTQTNHDMFCPGINYDFDGALWVTGGGNAQVTSVYNVANDAWDRDDDMRIPRGYQSAVTVSDGNIFTIGGSYSGARGGKIGERYDMNKGLWAKLPGCDVKPMLTADRGGVWRTDNHAWLFSWSNSWVLQAGPSNAMNWYDTKGQGKVVAAGLRNGAGGPDQMNGPAVMYDAGKIFTIGGAHDYSDSPAYSIANIIELSTPAVAPKVTWTGAGTYNRTLANSVVMPDGNIFVSGGQTYGKLFTDDNPVQTPEIFNTASKTFTTVARDPSPRTYHSIALLLPDATILTAGGGMCYDPKGNCPKKPADHFEGNVFRPPYLYNQDGSPAMRPVITNSPASADLGTTVQVTLDKMSAAPVFSLIRLGTVTHTVNTDQRRVVIPSKVLKRSTYNLQLPKDPGVLVPGYYHLFVVVGGVPSVSKTIKITTP